MFVLTESLKLRLQSILIDKPPKKEGNKYPLWKGSGCLWHMLYHPVCSFENRYTTVMAFVVSKTLRCIELSINQHTDYRHTDSQSIALAELPRSEIQAVTSERLRHLWEKEIYRAKHLAAIIYNLSVWNAGCRTTKACDNATQHWDVESRDTKTSHLTSIKLPT